LKSKRNRREVEEGREVEKSGEKGGSQQLR